MGLFNAIKNVSISKLGVPLINKYLADNGYDGIGKIEDLKIGGADKTITVHLRLKNDGDPVVVLLSGYSLKQIDNHYNLHWKSIEISRSLMATAAKKFLPNPIRLKGGLGQMLARVL